MQVCTTPSTSHLENRYSKRGYGDRVHAGTGAEVRLTVPTVSVSGAGRWRLPRFSPSCAFAPRVRWMGCWRTAKATRFASCLGGPAPIEGVLPASDRNRDQPEPPGHGKLGEPMGRRHCPVTGAAWPTFADFNDHAVASGAGGVQRRTMAWNQGLERRSSAASSAASRPARHRSRSPGRSLTPPLPKWSAAHGPPAPGRRLPATSPPARGPTMSTETGCFLGSMVADRRAS